MNQFRVGLALLLAAGPAVAADDALVSRIDAIGRQAVDHNSAPGVTIGVLRHGKVVINRGYGIADLENGVQARADSIFSIASVTKTLTAAAVLQLAENGSLALDDDVGKFIPEFAHKGEGVTLRRLLNHTAGVHDLTAIPAYWAQVGEPIEPVKLMAFFLDAPLDFQPGTSYAYSNAGYVLLGAVIEKASGVSYDQYLRKHFFVPLGLTHTSYCGTTDLIHRRARGYARDRERWVNARHVDMTQGYSAGGICSTTGDLLAWLEALSHGRVISRESFSEMTAVIPGRSYGLGFGEGTNAGHRVLFHSGGIQGFDAMVTDYPDDEVAIAVLANTAGDLTNDIEGRVARLVLSIPESAAQALTPAAAKSFAGTYHAARGFDVVIATRGDAFFLEFAGDPPIRLRYTGDGSFERDDSPDRIEIHGDHLALTHYGVIRFEATRSR